MEIQMNNKPVSNENKPASNESLYVKLMSEMRTEVKRMSHNELSRQYVHLFAQFAMLQKQFDEYKTQVLVDAQNLLEDLKTKNAAKTAGIINPSAETSQESSNV